MTTYEEIKRLNSVVTRMSDMYAGGKTGTDARGNEIGKEHELRALSMINRLQFEPMSTEANKEFNEAVNHFNYFRKLKYKCYVAHNKETPAFDSLYSQSQEEGEKELRKRIGKDAKDLYFWSVFVHKTGEEEKI